MIGRLSGYLIGDLVSQRQSGDDPRAQQPMGDNIETHEPIDDDQEGQMISH